MDGEQENGTEQVDFWWGGRAPQVRLPTHSRIHIFIIWNKIGFRVSRCLYFARNSRLVFYTPVNLLLFVSTRLNTFVIATSIFVCVIVCCVFCVPRLLENIVHCASVEFRKIFVQPKKVIAVLHIYFEIIHTSSLCMYPNNKMQLNSCLSTIYFFYARK